ncbi:MAG: hypothetical protein PHQ59_01270 [Candidatus Daviesbacteria bacterium]|nr:hypothetical protein [Candidatus Daviesbacteria bacterium]
MENAHNSYEVIKEGSYGEVSLVKQIPSQECKNALLSKMLGRYFKKPLEPFYPIAWANSILHKQRVWEDEVLQLPKGKNSKEQHGLTGILVATSILGEQIEESSGQRLYPYKFSAERCMTDFLEIIPPTTAAKIINSAADPDIARDFVTGEDLNNFNRDSLPLAIAVVVLLPSNARQIIFQEMKKITPSISNHTQRLLNLIYSCWNAPFSECNGQSIIKVNLPPTISQEKISEVWQNLLLLSKMVS